jgi:predicted ATPase
MIHLREIQFRETAVSPDTFPFNIPALQDLESLSLTNPVTFLVGENGSGKSTLLEALAAATGSITIGAADVEHDPTLNQVRQLADQLKLIWQKRTRNGFFLRAEDFFGYVKRLAQMRTELEKDLQQTKSEYDGRSQLAQNLARMPYARELRAMEAQYGRSLDSFSHGESFLELFQARFRPSGLYLLDEPEVPLSPSRQLTFIALLKQMVAEDSQFIIATHSPILLAFPGATILSFDERPLQSVTYEELEHVTLTRSFLNDPDQYLRYL